MTRKGGGERLDTVTGWVYLEVHNAVGKSSGFSGRKADKHTGKRSIRLESLGLSRRMTAWRQVGNGDRIRA